MPYDCDVIVVGSGAGGATFAYACALAGKSVLLIERGRAYHLNGIAHDERAMLIDKKPYDDREVAVNGSRKQLYMGGVVGGGTALYGAALLRPSRDDFHPGRSYGDRIPREIWDWPIAYDDLAPYYTQAEQLYRVAGCPDKNLAPLEQPHDGLPTQPLPLHPINQRLIAANRARGLRPFRLPLAIDPVRCIRCADCAGYICPTGAKSSSAHLVESAAAAGLPLRVLTHVEAERLQLNGKNQVDGLFLLDRATGQRSIVRARRLRACGGVHRFAAAAVAAREWISLWWAVITWFISRPSSSASSPGPLAPSRHSSNRSASPTTTLERVDLLTRWASFNPCRSPARS